MSDLRELKVVEIEPGDNDRQTFDPNGLEELAASIEAHGLAQPITVRPHGIGYQIVAGERRWRAVVGLGWPTIPAIVRDLDDEAAAAIMLSENLSRADLNPIEEANAYHSRMERFGWDIAKLAQIGGVGKDTVKSRLELLKLTVDIQHLVATGNLPLGHARLLTPLDHNRQRIATRAYNESGGMRINRFREMVQELVTEQSQDTLFDIAEFWLEQVAEEKEAGLWGKDVVLDVPKSTKLPWPKVTSADSPGHACSRYIRDLLDKGFEAEAQAVGNLYQALVFKRKAQRIN